MSQRVAGKEGARGLRCARYCFAVDDGAPLRWCAGRVQELFTPDELVDAIALAGGGECEEPLSWHLGLLAAEWNGHPAGALVVARERAPGQDYWVIEGPVQEMWTGASVLQLRPLEHQGLPVRLPHRLRVSQLGPAQALYDSGDTTAYPTLKAFCADHGLTPDALFSLLSAG